jgi:hypothetical protein
VRGGAGKPTKEEKEKLRDCTAKNLLLAGGYLVLF